MVTLRIKKLAKEVKLPKKMTSHAGAHDVWVHRIEKVAPDFVICHFGFAMQPSDLEYDIVLIPRSSLTNSKWILQNSPGLGDADFTKEYSLRFRCIPSGIEKDGDSFKLTYEDFPWLDNERVGQIYLKKKIEFKAVFVDELVKHDRGDGYGNTGNK